jgi:putative sigma-54 modulation protein
MKVQIQAVNFKADKELILRIEDKVATLDKYYDHIIEAQVYMNVQKTSEKANKHLELKLAISGDDIIAKKASSTFEDALNQVFTVAKKTLIKHKEKQRNK